MIVENKKVVSVNYHLTVKENDQEVLVEKTEAERPFVFLFGTLQMLLYYLSYSLYKNNLLLIYYINNIQI